MPPAGSNAMFVGWPSPRATFSTVTPLGPRIEPSAGSAGTRVRATRAAVRSTGRSVGENVAQ